MKLYIVRHGQTDDNVSNVLQGHRDVPLNKNGWKQAEEIAMRLRNERIDCAYSSDLQRAVHTAEIIVQYHAGIQIISTPRLRETAFGVLEGQPIEVLKERDKNNIPFGSYSPEKGESWLQTQERALKVYKENFWQHSKENVLWVTHGGVIVALLSSLFEEPLNEHSMKKYKQKNCALTLVEIIAEGRKIMHCLNSTEHLTWKKSL